MNVLRVSYIDPTLDRCSAAHEWLSSSDLYRSRTSTASTDSGAIYVMESMHVPSAAAAIHLLCRVEQRPDLTFTSRDLLDARYSQESNQSLVQKFFDGVSPEARSSRRGSQMVTETIPYTLWVLSAGVGSSALDRGASAFDLLNQGEVVSFNDHVAVLSSLGLSYVVSHEDGEYHATSYRASFVIRLEPPLHRLVQIVDLNLPADQIRREVAPAVSYYPGVAT